MELVAGDVQDILVLVGTDDRAALRDPARFGAYLALSGMDPTWLDYFAEAARHTLDAEHPVDFIDARIELGAEDAALTVERVDPAWVDAVARLPDATLDAITGRWIDRLEEELGELPREEKPWIRDLANQVVAFCRTAERSPDVVFLWSLG
jgi:hypothetical protein